MLIVKVHQLNSIVVVLYRPPDTTSSELRGALSCLDDTLSSLPSPLPSIVICGDLNLRQKHVSWKRSEDGDLVPCVGGHREGETSDRPQASRIIDICQKFGMVQQVDKATRSASGEILDLVFTSDEDLVSYVETEDHLTFTDHAVVTCYTNFKSSGQTDGPEKSYLCENGERYGKLDFHNAPWAQLKEELGKLDWSDLPSEEPNGALNLFHGKVLTVLEKLVPAKKAKPSKYRMPKQRKQFWAKMSKVNDKLGRVSSARQIVRLLKEKKDLEHTLKLSYSQANLKSEKEAVSRI